ncbi:MAG: glycosyltransferase [Patescibacteria group bacterium]
MKVCVIIPALNEEKFIGKLINSINSNSHKEKEVIVVDDGSTDKTVEIARTKGAKVFINSPTRRGPSFGRNLGAKKTNAEILCFLDADCFIEDKNFIKKAVKIFDENTVAVKTSYNTIQDKFIEKIVTKKQGISMEPKFIRRTVFLELGGFPLIGFGEDQIFVYKLKKYIKENNLEEKIVKEIYFSGHGVHTIFEMYKQAKWYGKTSIPFIKMVPKEFKAKQLISVYLRPFYFLSFFSLIFSLYFLPLVIFVVPFSVIFFSIIFKAIKTKNAFVLGKAFTFLFFGLGMIHGLVIYLFGIDRKFGS